MTSASTRRALHGLFGMSLLLAALPGIGASRLNAGDVETSLGMSDEAGGVIMNSSAGGGWSPWEVKFKGLSCLNIETAPFVGLQKHWPSCMSAAGEEGRKLAQTRNCKLCDVTFAGSKPEAETGMKSTKCSALVKCAAGFLDPSLTCLSNNGRVGMVEKMNSKKSEREAHPNRACYPCPPECKTCIFDDSYTNWALGKKSFKCIMSPTGGDGQGGATCVKPAGIECGECGHRNCGGVTNSMFGKWTCDNNDFKADCKWASEFQIPSDPQAIAVDESLREYAVTMQSGRDSSVLPPVLTILTQTS